jgi:LPXTG-site transpeptidase (sortase) family protein
MITPRKNVLFRPNLFAVLGLLILFMGFNGVLSQFKDVVLGQNMVSKQVVEEGDTPYLVPVSENIPSSASLQENSAPTHPLISGINPLPYPQNYFRLEDPVQQSTTGEKSQSTNLSIPLEIDIQPDRLVIPVINLDASIMPADYKILKAGAQLFEQWIAPDQKAVGWQTSSAQFGDFGNMVLNGHHNEFGEVFRRLVDLKIGDLVQVYAGNLHMDYVVSNIMILPEKYADMPTRLYNARWLMPSNDQRLTMVTCWPYESNTHRLIIVALPRASVKTN